MMDLSTLSPAWVQCSHIVGPPRITRNRREPSSSTGDSRQLLTPRGQGLQGIRAGLIGLGWIRGQGSRPTAQGGRFRCLLEQCARHGDSTCRTWAQGTTQSQPSALSSERRFSLNIPNEEELGSKPYKHPWADGVGRGWVRRLLLPWEMGIWEQPKWSAQFIWQSGSSRALGAPPLLTGIIHGISPAFPGMAALPAEGVHARTGAGPHHPPSPHPPGAVASPSLWLCPSRLG